MIQQKSVSCIRYRAYHDLVLQQMLVKDTKKTVYQNPRLLLQVRS